jgi:tripartite-type tricarboxylate transporter receptor subunit TctC
MTRLFRVAMLGGLVLAGAMSAARAENSSYPDHSVKVIVPFAPGGVVDVMARQLAQKLSEELRQQFYIENLGGGGGNIGTRAAAASSPDGYTLLITSSSFVVNPSLDARKPYDPIKDFAPVTIAAASPNVLVVYPGEAAKSVTELVDAIKGAPGTYSFASAGVGTTPHLSGELFRLSTQTDLIHVPFSGSGPALQSTIAGHTRIAFTGLPPAVMLIKSGSLRALAMTADKRSSALPDLPTMAEAGLPGQEAETLLFVLVPAGTSAEIVAVLNRAVLKILALPDIQETFETLGFNAVGNTPDQAALRVSQEITKWAKVIQDANLKQ